MRRYWVVALAVLTLLGVLSPPAVAQAPAPKVTITGLIDTVTFYGKNYSQEDRNIGKDDNDSQWLSRNRGVFTMTGEVGKAKGVLALELDIGWGVTADTQSTPAVAQTGGNPAFLNQSFGGGNDVNDIIEIKWMYVEFPVPLIPVPTTLRLGGQPANFMYKPGILLSTDMPGVSLTTTWTPAVTTRIDFWQVDEQSVGVSAQQTANKTAFRRGDDIIIAVYADVAPMKGLNVLPFYIYSHGKDGSPSSGSNSTANFPAVGGVTNAQLACTNAITAPHNGLDNTCREERHYFGVDARWRSGPFSLDPTFIYLTGKREMFIGAAAGGVNQKQVQTRSSWILDLRGGFRIGSLQLDGLFVYSPGNDAEDNIGQVPGKVKNAKYFTVLGNDIAYGAGGAISNFFALNGIDYIKGYAVGTSLFQGGNTSYDRYGRFDLGFKPSYALTPALTIHSLLAAHWTAEDVDRNARFNAATGLYPAPRGSQDADSKYLGTELNLGVTWRFAPGLTLDAGTGVLFAGKALERCRAGGDTAATLATPCTDGHTGTNDAYYTAARVRYTF
jgi:hypothetical protein